MAVERRFGYVEFATREPLDPVLPAPAVVEDLVPLAVPHERGRHVAPELVRVRNGAAMQLVVRIRRADERAA